MDKKKRIPIGTPPARFLFSLAMAGLMYALPAGAEAGSPIGPQPEAPDPMGGVPQLEIREYRFAAYPHGGYERLVLEFTRKDADATVQPEVKVVPVPGSSDVDIQVGHAMLMGAIPEALINDAYMKKSHYLGALSVNSDNPASGFALRTSLKNPRAKIRAFWLANRPRLVIDARFEKAAVKSSKEQLAIHREHEGVPPFDRFVCFPASSSVGMNVIFQPNDKKDAELKNVHINLQGVTNDDGSAATAPDAIVCYPRSAQVIASLTFDTTVSGNQDDAKVSSNGRNGSLKGTTVLEDSDMTLEPPAAGQAMPKVQVQAAPKADPRSVAGTAPPAPAVPLLSVPPAPALLNPPAAAEASTQNHVPQEPPSSSPASLLPPLK